jgi:ferredoxin-like protein FixX
MGSSPRTETRSSTPGVLFRTPITRRTNRSTSVSRIRPVPIRDNLPKYGEPGCLYCPALVYEVVYDDEASKTNPRFVINAQNCVNCKTCGIKDPAQNIDWTLHRRRRRPKQRGDVKSTGVATSSEIRARRPRSTPKSTGEVFCLPSHAFPCRAREAGQGGAKAPRNRAVAASAGKRVKKVA